ncbi:hypothetical protein DGG96_08945 [Legionella qingyii]|uniref:Uncharacterized protein n=1 Tax=Legionella qingyii TaxID=2184757 RepID=A0A317U1Y5_9GAMM|nr:hypothetical protein [Legionella qingyii]PWY56054.1 hypothetical protein DGG96_08945 [Legionella qingyii]RUR22057.1 hypothetical protein ELY20_10865 [Legionella qingyii]RUR25637.1 hypothetical protein ELY16_09675 [Legionella qingyii]
MLKGNKLRTAFIETSAINWFYKNQFNAVSANKLLASKNLIPVVGMDTIYELARCFTVEYEKAVNLFNFLKQLKPVYSCQRKVLYEQELNNLMQGSSVDPLLGYYTEEILTDRIKHYSMGIFDKTHEEFIIGRQFFWDDCREKLWSPENIKRNKGLTLQAYLTHCFKQIEITPLILQKWIEELTGKILSKDNIATLLKKLNTLPALRTALYSQFYLNFLIIRNQATPREDRFTDSLQVIAASYFSVIISHDNYLLNTLLPSLNPDQLGENISSLVDSVHGELCAVD